MRVVIKKLKSKRGASIILALLFFLVCAVIGGIVLASASSNAGRLSHMREEQQAYLTVSSAVKLLSGELEGQSFAVVETSVDGEPKQPVYSRATGGLAAQLNAWADYVYTGGLNAPAGDMAVFEIVSSSQEVSNVSATFHMDYNYNITVVFSLSGSGQYEMTLKLMADVSISTVESVEEVVGPDEEPVEIRTVTTTTGVTWGTPVITKGGTS